MTVEARQLEKQLYGLLKVGNRLCWFRAEKAGPKRYEARAASEAAVADMQISRSIAGPIPIDDLRY